MSEASGPPQGILASVQGGLSYVYQSLPSIPGYSTKPDAGASSRPSKSDRKATKDTATTEPTAAAENTDPAPTHDAPTHPDVERKSAQPDDSTEQPNLGHQRQTGTPTAPDRDSQQALRKQQGEHVEGIEDNSQTMAEIGDGDGTAPTDDVDDEDHASDDAASDGPAVADADGIDPTAKPTKRKRVKDKLSHAKASLKSKLPGSQA